MAKSIIFSVAVVTFGLLALMPLAAQETLQSENQAGQTEENTTTDPFSPLADQPETLRPLDKKAPIWVTPDRTTLVLGGEVCLREGLLELFACAERSKEHESIVVLKIKPHLIHAGLLVLGAKQGSPARFDPVFVPPSGEKIHVEVRWRDETGEVQRASAQEWVREARSGKEMTVPWVFTGGLFGTDADGNRYYLADVSGEIIGVSNFPGSVLDVPFESVTSNDNLYYEPNTEKIPPLGTPVTLLLTIEQDEPSELPSKQPSEEPSI
ncbi:MAG: YdjY domain-containing protein [Planctomycetia bacterium]|nr:YdjY domain-containing protein [Planctomycetia bacterium]